MFRGPMGSTAASAAQRDQGDKPGKNFLANEIRIRFYLRLTRAHVPKEMRYSIAETLDKFGPFLRHLSRETEGLRANDVLSFPRWTSRIRYPSVLDSLKESSAFW